MAVDEKVRLWCPCCEADIEVSTYEEYDGTWKWEDPTGCSCATFLSKDYDRWERMMTEQFQEYILTL